jgi:hypothetical protein
LNPNSYYQILSIVCHTKKYKYNRCKHKSKIKDVWGEIIKKVAIIAMLVMAMVAVPAMAQDAAIGNNGVDILGNGIFETGDSAFKFPIVTDTNFDSVIVGNDNARAIGWAGPWPFLNNGPANAQNNLEIKKNQNVGECACCQALDTTCPCQDCCIKYNLEQIKVGNRNAMAIGVGAGIGPFAANSGAIAENNIKIVTNQE